MKKGDWTTEEDFKLFSLFNIHGSSWTKLTKHFMGRTENSIKNRFYSTIRKIKADLKKKLVFCKNDYLQNKEVGRGTL